MFNQREQGLAKLATEIRDLWRQVDALRRLDVAPSPSSLVTYSGAPVAGDVAYWTGQGTVTTAGFGTATIVRTSDAQSIAGVKTFTNGISLGNETLSTYDEGTWTPVVADATSGGNLASLGTIGGRYIRIGKQVTIWCSVNDINTSGMTAGNTLYFRGLPFANATGVVAYGATRVSRITFTSYVVAQLSSGASYITFREFTSGNNLDNDLIVSDVAGVFADIYFTMTYMVD